MTSGLNRDSRVEKVPVMSTAGLGVKGAETCPVGEPARGARPLKVA